ncbi:SAM-dependent methyltransferase [Bosea sp. AAP35]|uniref:DUF938 domain-containing protein n=1 Tax=Bosea sp. AAP35 TaxID=1523417 RepID=UPI0006B991D9|nr:DUF938 domain-containing protein [Bosea sp. AAP35]KPF71654.1 SAM-dependent methyltransferase [Bosea sp. AAP35]
MSETRPAPWEPSQQKAQDDRRLHAPAVARNREAILAMLRAELPVTGSVLELASGSGEHAVHFAQALPRLIFQPSDPSPEALASIAAWTRQAGVANIRAPLQIDAAAPDWAESLAQEHAPDAILCINMIHIAPWAAAQGLVRGAGTLLAPGAPLILYGPFRRAGRPLEPGNAAFDDSLRERNPDWGLRELGAVAALAAEAGFGAPSVIEMPANNLSLIFRR